jgi:hypothetical protein
VKQRALLLLLHAPPLAVPLFRAFARLQFALLVLAQVLPAALHWLRATETAGWGEIATIGSSAHLLPCVAALLNNIVGIELLQQRVCRHGTVLIVELQGWTSRVVERTGPCVFSAMHCFPPGDPTEVGTGGFPASRRSAKTLDQGGKLSLLTTTMG